MSLSDNKRSSTEKVLVGEKVNEKVVKSVAVSGTSRILSFEDGSALRLSKQKLKDTVVEVYREKAHEKALKSVQNTSKGSTVIFGDGTKKTYASPKGAVQAVERRYGKKSI